MVAINFFFDSFQFNLLFFFILFAIAYLFSVFLGFKSIISVIALHSVLIFVFAIIGIIDYFYMIFAILEIAILLKMKENGGIENTSD